MTNSIKIIECPKALNAKIRGSVVSFNNQHENAHEIVLSAAWHIVKHNQVTPLITYINSIKSRAVRDALTKYAVAHCKLKSVEKGLAFNKKGNDINLDFIRANNPLDWKKANEAKLMDQTKSGESLVKRMDKALEENANMTDPNAPRHNVSQAFRDEIAAVVAKYEKAAESNLVQLKDAA